MNETNQEKLDLIAKKVLAEYKLNEPHLTFIRHSDNATYKVTSADSNSFLLRLHTPVTSAMGNHGENYDMVNSEVVWLLALDQETNLNLQKPLRNRSGALVTRFPMKDGKTVNCSMLRWIDGEPYHRDLESEQTAYQIGTILATLHNHASQWKIPERFERPKRDAAYFENVLKALSTAVRNKQIKASDYEKLSESISLLVKMMSKLHEDQHCYGLMHADTHKGNMLYCKGNISLIDFSFCAFGNYMFDLGICLSDMKDKLHSVCLEGYQSLRELPYNYRALIEGFFIGSMVGTFSFWASNPHTQEILVRKVPQVTKDYVTKFIQGEHFWFSS